MRGRHLGRRSGHHSSKPLALLAATAALGAGLASGCSWLYDPDDLVDYIKPEPPPEPLVCEELLLDELPASFALLEGVGDFGSRPAVLVISGANIIPEATIAITGMDGLPVTGVELAGPAVITGGYGTHLAVPVIARVNRTLAAGVEVPLKITVSQGCAESAVSRSIEGRLRGFDELISTGAINLYRPLANAPTYSVVNIATRLEVDPTYTENHRLIIRSNSSITIGGDIQVNADEIKPGAGGSLGGPGTTNGVGPGKGLGFPAALLTAGNGGGAGFATPAGGTLPGAMAGDPFVTDYGSNLSSGGGGGAGLLGSAGGAGGAGGGTVELSALGTTTLRGTISAKGGNGRGGDGSAGGGGSGGLIVVRGGTKVDAPMTFDVSGGSSRAAANGGARGRIRIDGPEQILAPATKDVAVRGVTFPLDVPLTTDKKELELPLIGSPQARTSVLIASLTKALVDEAEVNFESASQASVTVQLARGYNRICVSPVSAENVDKAVSTNCIEIASIPTYVAPPDPNGKGKNR